MRSTPRALALVAVLALPAAAIVATLLLRTPAEPPAQTPVVRIGGADGTGGSLPSLNQPRPTQESPGSRPQDEPDRPGTQKPPRDTVPPPPPVDDDDDDDRDDDDDDDDDDDRDDDDD